MTPVYPKSTISLKAPESTNVTDPKVAETQSGTTSRAKGSTTSRRPGISFDSIP